MYVACVLNSDRHAQHSSNTEAAVLGVVYVEHSITVEWLRFWRSRVEGLLTLSHSLTRLSLHRHFGMTGE